MWAVFGGFIVLAIVSRLVISMRKKNLAPWLSRSIRKLYKMFLTMGLIGLLLLFFGYEGIPYFSSRPVYALWALAVVVWTVCILVHVLKHHKQDKLDGQKEKMVKQYLPGGK